MPGGLSASDRSGRGKKPQVKRQRQSQTYWLM